ncbi:MAG TPA: hypothetical protein VFI73_10140 [Candidatus Nitrosopolaris sp.]|nr:hypothetical protein [Candidatus Nitrosopolaris sp.]
MLKVEEFLDEHKREIVDFVQQKNIFDMLVKALAEQIPLGRDGLTWEDKAHKELAVAMIHSMWCGWLSQAKKNSGAYTQGYVDSFKQFIIRAFEIGQNYATERP